MFMFLVQRWNWSSIEKRVLIKTEIINRGTSREDKSRFTTYYLTINVTMRKQTERLWHPPKLNDFRV